MICPVCPVCPAASYGAYPICKGCSVCSRDNGCVNCQPKLFLFLRRERMRQYGECLHDCPAGYYGMRSPELNMCSSKSSPHLTSHPHPSISLTLPWLAPPPTRVPKPLVIYWQLSRGDTHTSRIKRLICPHRWREVVKPRVSPLGFNKPHFSSTLHLHLHFQL